MEKYNLKLTETEVELILGAITTSLITFEYEEETTHWLVIETYKKLKENIASQLGWVLRSSEEENNAPG